MNQPPEIQRKILLNVDYPTVINYCKTSRAARTICDDRAFWVEKLKLQHPDFVLSPSSDPQTVMYLFYLKDNTRTVDDRPQSDQEYLIATGIGLPRYSKNLQDKILDLNFIYFTQLANNYLFPYDSYIVRDNYVFFPYIFRGRFSYFPGDINVDADENEIEEEDLPFVANQDIFQALGSEQEYMFLVSEDKFKSEIKDILLYDFLRYLRPTPSPSFYSIISELLNSPIAKSGLFYLHSQH